MVNRSEYVRKDGGGEGREERAWKYSSSEVELRLVELRSVELKSVEEWRGW